MVLARLDRADIDEIRPFELRRAIRRRPCGRSAPNGATSTGGLRPARSRCGCNASRVAAELTISASAKCDRRLDPAQVVLGLAGLGVFGKFDRDQVVDQADEASHATLLHPRDQAAFFQMVMRDQQIDRRRLPRSRANSACSRPASSETRARRAIRRTRRSFGLRIARRRARPRRWRRRTAWPSALGSSASLPIGVTAVKAALTTGRDQVFGIGKLDAINTGRRAAPGARQEAVTGREQS